MESQLAVIGIILRDYEETDRINSVVHKYRNYVIGRMGLPHARSNEGVINIVVDAPCDVVKEFSREISEIEGVKSQTLCSMDCE